MEPVLYSWLGAAAIAPFVAILSAWTLVVFRSYRRRWRVVDLFLFALTAHEVASALFGFGFAVLSLIRPVLDAPCGFIVWGLSATRTFHLSAVTSLLVDRALTVRWPYTYRLSVRSSQVRYHVVVLAIIAVFVGVTAVFARVPGHTRGFCSIHPLAWDAKFSVFLASVYGMLLLTGFACCLIVQAGRMRVQGCKEPSRPGRESGFSTSSSNSSRPLQPECREFQDLGWRAVACVSWLSCILNHGPFLVMTIMGTVVPTFWSNWLDNITIWLRLAQGTLVPLMLLLTDLPHRSALRNMLRQPGRIYRHLSDHGGFRMQVGDLNCTKSGILPSLMMYSGEVRRPMQPFPMPQRLRWTPHMLPSLQALQPEKNLRTCKTPSDTDSTAKWSSPFPEQHIYASLGSSYSTSLRSSDSKIFLSCSDDAGSITTDAIDDFEFHGSLPKSPVFRDNGHDLVTSEDLEPHPIFRTMADLRKYNSSEQEREDEDREFSYSEGEDLDLHQPRDTEDLEPAVSSEVPPLSAHPNTEIEDDEDSVAQNTGQINCHREFILHPCLGCESPFTAHLQEPPFVDSNRGDSGVEETRDENTKRNHPSPTICGVGIAERIRRFQEASAEGGGKDAAEEEEDESSRRRSPSGNHVVSVSTMLATLEAARFSYLDNGDLCTHRPSQLLEQRVIFSDYV